MRLSPYCERSEYWRPSFFWTNYGHRVHGIEVNLCRITLGLVFRL